MNRPDFVAAAWLGVMRFALREAAVERRVARFHAYRRAGVPAVVAEALDDDAHLGETLRRGRARAKAA